MLQNSIYKNKIKFKFPYNGSKIPYVYNSIPLYTKSNHQQKKPTNLFVLKCQKKNPMPCNLHYLKHNSTQKTKTKQNVIFSFEFVQFHYLHQKKNKNSNFLKIP